MFKYVVYSNGRPCDEYGYDLHEAGTHHSSWSASNYLINWLGYKGVDNLNKEFPIDTIIETVDISGEAQLMEIKKVWLSKEEILENMKEYATYSSDKSFYAASLLIENGILQQMVEQAVTSEKYTEHKVSVVIDLGAELKKSSELKKARKAIQTCTYLVRNPLTNLIKIGKSENVNERINNLSLMNGVELETLAVISKNIERELHLLFKDYRKFGEWFEDRDGLIYDYIQSNT